MAIRPTSIPKGVYRCCHATSLPHLVLFEMECFRVKAELGGQQNLLSVSCFVECLLVSSQREAEVASSS